ncbi:MAG: rRNA pseudouridine synthase [Thermomicrobiales bacterium]|nr:rRNA pseudouridine synthase [Thermomicrobiales bacterium]
MEDTPHLDRLQRILSSAGVASRRAAEQMILDRRVSVNGKIVDQLGSKADPIADEIRVDGKLIRPQHPRYVMLNKPDGYITTMEDERGRPTVMQLVESKERIYPVGRLDRDTEGLLLLTNDGLVAHRIMHPSFELQKEYEVLTPAMPHPDKLAKLRVGVRVDGKKVVPEEARIQRESAKGVVLRITIHEGMTHVVRKMMSALEIPVLALRRTRIGPLTMSGLQVGSYRDLRPGEIASLFEALKIDAVDDDSALVSTGGRKR